MDTTNIQSQSVFYNCIWIANPFINCGGLQIRHINKEIIPAEGTTRLKEFTEFIGFPNKELVQKFLSDKDLLMKIRNANCLRLRV